MKTPDAIRAYYDIWRESAEEGLLPKSTASVEPASFEAGLASGMLMALSSVLEDKDLKDEAKRLMRRLNGGSR